jgi:hypothetical protein
MLLLFWISTCTFCIADGDKEITTTCQLLFPQSATSSVNTIYIPFRLVGRLMVVEAEVDAIRGNFIFDTGSERLLLNKDYITCSPSAKMVASVGNTGGLQAKEHRIDSISLEQLTIPDLLAHVVDLNHIEVKKNTKILGILGYNVFKDFEILIDFPNSRLRLSRIDKNGNRVDGTLPWEKPVDSLNFEMKKHFIVVKSVINYVTLDMILDSGAELNLIDRKVNKKVIEKFTVIKRVNLIGAGKKQVEVLAGILKNVKCGNQSTAEMNTLLTSMDEINTSFGINVHGVLGYEFLSTRRTLINYKKRKLYFFSLSGS